MKVQEFPVATSITNLTVSYGSFSITTTKQKKREYRIIISLF